jgi:hypothetical protein
VASAVPQANGEAPPLPHRRGHTPLPHAKSPSPYPAANGEVATDSSADAVKAEPSIQGTTHVSCCGRQSSVFHVPTLACVCRFAFGHRTGPLLTPLCCIAHQDDEEPLAWLPATPAALALRLAELDAAVIYTPGQPPAREAAQVSCLLSPARHRAAYRKQKRVMKTRTPRASRKCRCTKLQCANTRCCRRTSASNEQCCRRRPRAVRRQAATRGSWPAAGAAAPPACRLRWLRAGAGTSSCCPHFRL